MMPLFFSGMGKSLQSLSKELRQFSASVIDRLQLKIYNLSYKYTSGVTQV